MDKSGGVFGIVVVVLGLLEEASTVDDFAADTVPDSGGSFFKLDFATFRLTVFDYALCGILILIYARHGQLNTINTLLEL